MIRVCGVADMVLGVCAFSEMWQRRARPVVSGDCDMSVRGLGSTFIDFDALLGCPQTALTRPEQQLHPDQGRFF